MGDITLYSYLSGDILLDTYADSQIYANCTWITAHNAFANKEDGWHYAQQDYNLNTLFDDYKIRAFSIDAHYHNGKVALCHETEGQTNPEKECRDTKHLFLRRDPDLLETWLVNLKALLDENLKDIVTLHVECYVDAKDLKQAFIKAKIDHYLLESDPNYYSITLGKLRETGTRLIVFSDYAFSRHGTVVSGILPTTLYKETKFNVDNSEEVNNCVLRDDYRSMPGEKGNLFVLNHFPSLSAAKDYGGTINKYISVVDHIERCLNRDLPIPNFIVIDKVHAGEGFSCKGSMDLAIKLNLARRHNLPSFKIHSNFNVESVSEQKSPLQDNEVFNIVGAYAKQSLHFSSFKAWGYIVVLNSIDYLSEDIRINVITKIVSIASTYTISNPIHSYVAFVVEANLLVDTMYNSFIDTKPNYKPLMYPKLAFNFLYLAYNMWSYSKWISIVSFMPIVINLGYNKLRVSHLLHHKSPEDVL